MALSTQLIAGLSSGFDWRSMIDQLIAIEHRRVDLVEGQKTEYQSKLSILQSINTKLLAFKTQADTLSKSDAFNVFATSLTTDSTTYKASDFLSVSTSTSAAPGTHTITMGSSSQVAQTRQISSKSFTTYDTALGLPDDSEFVINGRAIKVDDTDDLMDIRNKINNLNTGTNATGVTASILTVSSTDYRLILTSDETGEDAFSILDASADTVDILQNSSTKPGLGFLDSTTPTIKNITSDGAESDRFSSSDVAVGSLLGLTNAQEGIDITVGTTSTLDIDLAVDSLTSIATKINALSGVSASVESVTEDGTTRYYIDISGTTNFGDKNNVLQTLGILVGGQSNVAEVHAQGSIVNTDGDAVTQITTATVLTNLWSNETNSNVAVGDKITIKGTRGDGSVVNFDYTIGAGNTIQTLLDQINNTTNGFGKTGSRTATASLSSGKIVIEDDTPGDSQLSLTLVANNNGGGTLDFDTISATTEGYNMETQAGKDANITIDGTTITSSSNIIDDVIAGVTLNLLTVEQTKTVTLTISRDYDAVKSSVQTLLNQYNDVMSDINEQFAYDEETGTAGLLQGDGTLSSIKSNLVNIVVSTITGLPSTMNALSLIGITSDNDGMLSIDDDDFKDAFEDNFNDLRRIFIAEGSTTDGDIQYISHTRKTVAGDYAVKITQAAEQAQTTGTEILTSGIGATDIETLTITQGSKTAAITLNGATGENGSTIDNIVNAINSELDTEYAQSIMGNVKNTTDAAQENPITSSTTWDAVYSGGSSAGLADNDVIKFTGHKSNGQEVSGSYTISKVAEDTVQGLLSAIEAAYGYEVSAGINTNGYIVVTDNTTGNSQLSISLDYTDAHNLDFGDVTASNLVGSVRNTKNAGANAIEATDTWDDIDGETLAGGEWVYFSGHTVDGNAVEGSYQVNKADALSIFLGQIKTAYDNAGGNVTVEIQDGRIVIKDGTSNSTLGIEIFEPSGGGVDFGTLAGGVTGRYSVGVTASKDASDHLVLTHDGYGSGASFTVEVSGTDLGLTDNATHQGVDVDGTINSEDATGSGQLLKGDAPGEGETTSVEGLSVKVTLTSAQLASQGENQGNVKITMGVAELFDRVLYDITNEADGYLDYRLESMGDRIDDLEDNIEEMEARLNRKMETMINRFVYMELALAQIQNQSNWLAGQLNASWSGWSW
ncbi:MAG: flagellar filament capping protein FliD [Desulfobacterales bacterium]|nr:flagellar filament capping protein FliD [Desulfobacterales bacterium]